MVTLIHWVLSGRQMPSGRLVHMQLARRIGMARKSCSLKHRSDDISQGFAQKHVQMSDREWRRQGKTY
jgi:hypothetical protein